MSKQTKNKFEIVKPTFNRDNILRSASRPREWFNIKNENEVPEVFIFDQIGLGWWGDGVSPQDFINQVKEIEEDAFNLHINSPGGFVNDGLAIYNFLNRLEKNITVYIDGIAASIASIIAMAGDEIIMPENAQLMIHNAWTIGIGNKKDFRDLANKMETIDLNLVNILHARSGYNLEKIANMMEEETYISGIDAFEMGFATKIEDNKKLAACAFEALFAEDVKGFNNKIVADGRRNLEKTLRDVGYSKNEAKTIVNRRDAVNFGKEVSNEESKPITIIMR